MPNGTRDQRAAGTLIVMSDGGRSDGQAWSSLDDDTEWCPALRRRVGGTSQS